MKISINTNQENRAYLQIFIAGIFWGTTGLFIELLSNLGASNALISMIRVGTGAIVMFPIVWLKCGGAKAFRIDKKTLFFSAMMGFIAHTMFNICYTQAVQSVGIATAAVLLYSSLIFVCILSRILFGELITSLKMVALIINIIGCTLTVTGGKFNTFSFVLYGTIMGVLAALCYSASPILGKIMTKNTHPYVISFYNFMFGALFLIPFLFNEPLIHAPITTNFIALALSAGIFSSVIPSTLFMTGLSKPIEASKVNVISSMKAVVASIIGVFLFSEFFNIWKLFGIFLVLASIVIMNMSPQKKVISE